MMTPKFSKLSFLTLLFLSAFVVQSQTESSLLKNARKALDNEDYSAAKENYRKLNQLSPNNPEYLYETGLAYYFAEDKEEAIEYFEQSLQNSKSDTIIETFYYLANAYQEIGNPTRALSNYEKFKPALSDHKSHLELKTEVERSVELCKNVIREMAASRNLVVKNLGSNVNGPYADFAPVISLDQTAIFFTSRRLRSDSSNKNIISPVDGMHFEDAYVSYKNEETGEWMPPQILDFSKPNRHEATIGVSSDNQILFVYIDKQGGNVYFSENKGNKYGELEEPGSDINSDYWETHATISADGKTLYFVSNRPGGLGGRDIYRCVRLPDGKWSKAQNLGEPINTRYDEETPFLHPDGKTMFFSSNNNKTMGGFDIFFTQMQSDGTWSEPMNVGHPINTVGDDVFFSTSADGKVGYFASAREGGYGEKDIYMIMLDTVYSESIAIHKGFVINDDGDMLPPGVDIWVTNLTEGGDPLDYRPRSRDGGYILNLKPCIEYEIQYMLNSDAFHTLTMTVPCEANYYENNEVIRLPDVHIGGPVVADKPTKPLKDKEETASTDSTPKVPPIVGPAEYKKFYGYNQKDVNAEAKEYKEFIDKVVQIIAANESVALNIEGSASHVPTRTHLSNEKLAQLRVEQAKKMILRTLKARGIDEGKVKFASEKAVVAGPEYNNDAQQNSAEYGKYQYINITAK